MSAAVRPESAILEKQPLAEQLARWSARIEQEEMMPRELVATLGRHGYLGASIAPSFGGQGLDPREVGALHEGLARVHGSLENLLTVTAMSATAMQRFAEPALSAEWLPSVARGERVIAFAVTEPRMDREVADVQTQLREAAGGWRVTGEKQWISFGQIADAFLVLGRDRDRTLVCLVERDTAGVEVHPIGDMLGLRANALARVRFNDCRVPRRNVLGRSFPGIAPCIVAGLDEGRFLTAWGSLGIAQGALELAMEHSRTRYSGGKRICDHQLVQKMIAESIVAVKAARLLCEAAADARRARSPEMVGAALVAKYAASRAARLASDHAVQILGALGCHGETTAPRYFRDARMMEIIEGTTQIHELQIASYYVNQSAGAGGHA